uniref:Probable vanillin dehydrogenase n=1 Tax=Pseudomonas putida TaxID=303 RepID=A5HV15_PSEPU|nr:probable vanillin dehydrogenase [Pseudomonas putida]
MVSIPPYENLHLLRIGDQWREGSGVDTLTVNDPYTLAVLVKIRQGTRIDVDEAYAAAEDSQRKWAMAGPAARASVLHKAAEIFDRRKEEIIDWLIREAGSTRIKATIEWGAARSITQESASLCSRVSGHLLESNVPAKENRVYRLPIGVVGVISPWNFPLHLTQRSVAPALAVGNAVVIKPASDTPVTGGLLLAKIFEEAGLPPGLLNVVIGSGGEIGDYFVEHATPGFISFTGSTAVGKRIGSNAFRGGHIKHVALELGGNSPFIVLADADLKQAVNAAVVGKFLHQGQICMAINRIIVEDSIYEEFVGQFIARVSELKWGDPAKGDTVIGPIINAKQLDGLLGKIELARQEGAKLVCGGNPVGNVLPPHVFVDVTPEMEIAKEEIFGPLVGILRARDAEQALQMANKSEFGLSSAIFTGDLERGVNLARRIKAGMTHINDIPVNDEPHVPFGGEKNSGLGRFNGQWVLDELTTLHWISVQHAPRHYPF